MSTPTQGMATTKTETVKKQSSAKLKAYKEDKQPAIEESLLYVTTIPQERLFDVRIGYEYQDELIRGLWYEDTGNVVFEVPKKYKERFERNSLVKDGQMVIIDGE